ncbi:uncharacterized protein LOC100889699 [Strongylocentrotus purpuratus]|uniref:Uncharacterized protein n=1 Tax=Strongylocentrotus purpuratus TaxID=7668 RepID=A0A7M7GFW8_STRPU|nr:uncharacterized protein LOC100889699 [Strongylocentrotus purpuratus]|eukprot:XP_003724090.1 PREDICTED: uncharacterized protein LOC100889699 [Strongylocentrotus purpuratus]
MGNITTTTMVPTVSSSSTPIINIGSLSSSWSEGLSDTPIILDYSDSVQSSESSDLDEGTPTATSLTKEMLTSSCQDTGIFPDSSPPLLHGFPGGFISGVASLTLLLIIVALVVYTIRKRRRHDHALPPNVNVSALAEGVYQEYNGQPKKVEGVASTKGGDGQHYQEIITIKHDQFIANKGANKDNLVSSDNEYVYTDVGYKSDNEPTYSNVKVFLGQSPNMQSTTV